MPGIEYVSFCHDYKSIPCLPVEVQDIRIPTHKTKIDKLIPKLLDIKRNSNYCDRDRIARANTPRS